MTITLDGTTGVTTPGTTLSGGTANGVLYLNGSKVATSGSALTFDGNSLTVNGGASHTNFYLNNGTYSTLYYQNTGGASGVSVSGANYWTVTTNNAEQMRIDSSGNLLVGTTSTSHTTDGFTVEQGGGTLCNSWF